MAFHLCLSNSLEKLADEFYKKLCIPVNECKDPFAVIHTVVANSGMGTFLKRHLARQNKMGIAANIEKNGFRVLDVSLSEDRIIEQLKHLQNTGRYQSRPTAAKTADDALQKLSQREKDVLRLIVKGRLNKEVADELKISLATAIFHRNNICDKLQTRSVGKLTVMAVLSGLVDINEI